MDSVALCAQVRAISRTRLTKSLGRLPANRISQINAALKIALVLLIVAAHGNSQV
jgi:mRNA-degrading endonuclease toxin of MazEF toxin-antitoxin module